VVLKAIRYFLERENLAFRNGVFLIDFERLERQDWKQDMVRKLSEELGLTSTANPKDLIKEMGQRNMLIVITNCETVNPNHKLCKETASFF
jgi:hypothetical protein